MTHAMGRLSARGLVCAALVLGLAGWAQASLVGYWNFDETGGSLAGDASGQGAVGLIKGATPVAGKFGGAFDFNGTNNEVLINNVSSAFGSIGNQVTIAFWQWGTRSAGQTTFGGTWRGNPGSGRVLNSHLPWGGNVVYWDAGINNYDRINKTATVAEYTGGWSHWAFTKNATTGVMNIYRDGALWHTGGGKTKPMTGIGAFGIGSESGTNYWQGKIDEFAVWDQELTGPQIAALASAGGPMAITAATVNNSLTNSAGTLSPGGSGTIATTTFGKAHVNWGLSGTASQSSIASGGSPARAIDNRVTGI